MLTKILIIPRLISRDLTKSQVADSEIISEYNFVISRILSQLRRVLLSSPSSISSKEFGDFVLPKELLSNLVTLSKDGFKLLKKDVDGIDEVVSEVESKENIEVRQTANSYIHTYIFALVTNSNVDASLLAPLLSPPPSPTGVELRVFKLPTSPASHHDLPLPVLHNGNRVQPPFDSENADANQTGERRV